MKNKNERVDNKSAENEYEETVQDPSFQDASAEEEILLIKSYALEPSIDEMMWDQTTEKSNKPFRISGKTHGIVDYAFAATLLLAPSLLRLKGKSLLGLFGASTLLSAALTKDSLGIKPLLPLKTHRTLDIALLSGIAVAAVSAPVRKHKPTLSFTLSMLALGVTTVLLTDWKKSASDKK